MKDCEAEMRNAEQNVCVLSSFKTHTRTGVYFMSVEMGKGFSHRR